MTARRRNRVTNMRSSADFITRTAGRHNRCTFAALQLRPLGLYRHASRSATRPCVHVSAGCEQGFPGSLVERIRPAEARDSVKPRVRTGDYGYAVAEASSCMYAIVGAEVWGAERESSQEDLVGYRKQRSHGTVAPTGETSQIAQLCRQLQEPHFLHHGRRGLAVSGSGGYGSEYLKAGGSVSTGAGTVHEDVGVNEEGHLRVVLAARLNGSSCSDSINRSSSSGPTNFPGSIRAISSTAR